MKLKNKTLALSVALLTGVSSSNAAITHWEAASAAHADQVTTSTNGGAGYTLTGSSTIAYDFGDLSNGSITNIGPGNAVEFIFNLSDSGAAISIGGLNGWNNAEDYNFRLEQWNNTGTFGVTATGVIDATYTQSSIFNTDTHVVFVNRADNRMELYVNGVSQGVSSRDGGWVTNGGVGTLGGNLSGGDFSNGTIYGVASYDSALSAGDVTNLYNAYAAPVPEPSSLALLGLGSLALLRRRRK